MLPQVVKYRKLSGKIWRRARQCAGDEQMGEGK